MPRASARRPPFCRTAGAIAWYRFGMRTRAGPPVGASTCTILAVAKAVAGREKDLEFLRETLRHGLVDAATLRERLGVTPLDEERRVLAEGRIGRAARDAGA
jgi:hypothetical protein